ncbi:hypothetical protein [Malacoplasma iowae]|uniref:hypothetical protein n=1 Tax=Malacoplasma iowae TaxID=2116 RepID=UPI002A188EE9|nr:hypothetical protein [Malacoplasma iowae]WPL39570.1 hypothetical protein QX183_03420 [Malacoplasma iowae]
MKKSLKILTIGLSSITAIAVVPSIATINNNLTQSNLNYKISNPQTRAIENGEETTASFKFVSEDVAKQNEWWGKQTVDEVTNDQIKSLLIPYDSSSNNQLVGVNFNVQILPISNEDRNNGGVRFTITQIKKVWNDGTVGDENPTKEEKIKKPNLKSKEESIDNNITENDDSAYIWSTYEEYDNGVGGNFKDLAIVEKFNFAWNDDEEIGEFIKKTVEDGTKIGSDTINTEKILANMVKQDKNHILPEIDKITTSVKNTNNSAVEQPKLVSDGDDSINYQDWDKYGLLEVTIRFLNTEKTQWVGDKFPDGAIEENGEPPIDGQKSILIKRVFRGFNSSDTSQVPNTNVFLKTSSTNDVKEAKIKKDGDNNPFSKYLLNSESKLGDLMPSELKELSLNDNALLDFMYNGTFRDTTTNKKEENANSNNLIGLSFFGKDLRDFKDDINDNTKLPKNNRDDSVVKKIEVTPNDVDGSAIFTYYYDYYDVYTGKVVKDAVFSQSFPAGTFKKNPDAGKQLIMSAKGPNDISSFTSSKDLMDLYTQNKSDNTYLKSLSNLFVNGTNDALAKDRDVKFEYVNDDGKTRSDSPTQKVKMTLTFDSWNGESYMESGQKKEGKQIIQTFEFPSMESSVNVNWKTNQTVTQDINNIIKSNPNDQNKTIADFSPSEIVDLLYSNESLNTAFTNGIPTNATLSYFSDNATGSLIVKAQSTTTTVKSRSLITLNDSRAVNSGDIQTRIFTGFKATNEQFQEFGWIGNSEVDASLLQKELDSITVQDVIDSYLKKIDFFKDMELSESNVKIEKNSQTGTLTVYVTINEFNQDIPMANNKFSTVLRGFPVGTINDRNSYKAPVDLTIILSAVLGGLVVLGLGGYLGKTILNRIKTNKIKNKY